ncbi:hypothetical protein NLZ15_14965 [Atlantibacter subterranea]|uniref:hypothetical protein n=1 Tax=Atlantibacter subterraneus TaxID=255519 RepID=UPI0020C33BDE|nr:hypothetical protein [Atlantibacter subterranea]UTJ46150.1 hypothetical protein NLZ15_14965 [Atlantibacter subterranea]
MPYIQTLSGKHINYTDIQHDDIVIEDQAALCESLKIRDALAAENLALKEALKNGVVEKHQQTSYGISIGVKSVIVQREIETPATDAFLADLRSSGLDEMAIAYRNFANEEGCSCNMQSSYNLTAERAESYAAYIRRQEAAQLRGSQV